MARVGTLSEEYAKQYAWRAWSAVYAELAELGELRGARVLDLGAGIGDQAADLASRGARVVGVDAHPEIVAHARSRGIVGAEFVRADLRDLEGVEGTFDGVWSSFAAAYFVDFAPVLRTWLGRLRPGGWIALTEVDEFFGHEPLGAEARDFFAGYVEEARAAGRYDFRMGRRLRGHLEAAGARVVCERELEDRELAFRGAADPRVLEAWRSRLAWMKLLHERAGARWEALREEFLACLANPVHHATARVVFVLARLEKGV